MNILIETIKIKGMEKQIENLIHKMELLVLDFLSSKDNDYGFRKLQISKATHIPEDILTVILKRLKYKGEIELIMIWSENTGMPNGSGYRINNKK